MTDEPTTPPGCTLIGWVTVGENIVAICDGHSLLIRQRGSGFDAKVRINGEAVDYDNCIPTLPAAQACAVAKARELARTAKGEK